MTPPEIQAASLAVVVAEAMAHDMAAMADSVAEVVAAMEQTVMVAVMAAVTLLRVASVKEAVVAAERGWAAEFS